MATTTRARRTTNSTPTAADTRAAVALLRDLSYILAVTRRVSREITAPDAAADCQPSSDRISVAVG